MQRYSRSSNPTRIAVSTFLLTRIPTAGDSSRMWGSPLLPDIGTEVEVVRRPGAAVLGKLARCRQAPATTTTVVARAEPAAARAMVVDDYPARPEVRRVRLEVRLVRLEVRHDRRPGRYPRVVRSVHCSAAADRVHHRRSEAVRSAPCLRAEHPTRWGR
jgi:hypothetical protein